VSQPQRKRIKQALLKSEFFQDCLATKEVKLKAGAQVILVKNTYVRKGAMLPNGARGVIIAMVPKIKILRKLRLDSESLAALKSFEGNLLPQVCCAMLCFALFSHALLCCFFALPCLAFVCVATHLQSSVSSSLGSTDEPRCVSCWMCWTTAAISPSHR